VQRSKVAGWADAVEKVLPLREAAPVWLDSKAFIDRVPAAPAGRWPRR
jgi:hypothetical protein